MVLQSRVVRDDIPKEGGLQKPSNSFWHIQSLRLHSMFVRTLLCAQAFHSGLPFLPPLFFHFLL
jgi:hypothetical protein